MKKLITILLIFVATFTFSQQFEYLLNAKYTNNATGTALQLKSDNAWSVQAIWSSATGTVNGQIIIEVSNDGVNYIQHSSTSVITLSGASGSIGYDVGHLKTAWVFIRARYVRGTTTSVVLKVNFSQFNVKTQ